MRMASLSSGESRLILRKVTAVELKTVHFHAVSGKLGKETFLLDRPLFRANFGVPLRGATALQRDFSDSAGKTASLWP
jgi:hypothetical protein